MLTSSSLRFLVFFFWFLAFTSLTVLAQERADTVYTMADTALARQLLEEVKDLIDKRQLDEALEKAMVAERIYGQTVGVESREMGDVWFQMGRNYYFRYDLDDAQKYYENALRIRLEIYGENHPDVAGSYHNLGLNFYDKGEYDKAIEYHQKALEIRLKTLGPEHPDVASSYNSLCASFNNNGEYDKAIEYYKKSLEIKLKTLGPEHPDVANAYNNLGVSFNGKGEYDKSIEYFEKALEIRLKTLGSEHLDVASSYNNLGASFNDNGEYDKAIEYYKKSLEIKLKTLGPEHPDVASSYNNLGNNFSDKGEYDKAIEYHQKALELRLKTLGPEHPDVASSYNSLGGDFSDKGEYDKAIEYHQKALELRLKTLGPEHPDVASSYNSLGGDFSDKGEYDKAIEFHQKALEIRLKTLGPEHPRIAFSYGNLGNSFNDKGEYNKAIEYHKKSLEIELKTLGPEHPEVAFSYNNLGVSFNNKGEYYKAIEYYKKSLEIMLNTLGPEHYHVASSYDNLGNNFSDMREYDKAIEYQQRALEVRLKTLGPAHPYVAVSYNNLGNSFDDRGEFSKAIEYHQKALEIRLKTLGPEHPILASSYSNLGVSFNNRGEYDKAIEYHQKALEIELKTLGPENSDVASSYNNLGASFSDKGEYDKAIALYKQALTPCNYARRDFSRFNSLEPLLESLRALSKTFQIQYFQSHSPEFLSQSFDYAHQSIAALDYQQSSLRKVATKSLWQGKNYPVYEQAISATLLKADVDKDEYVRPNAFTYAEKSKSSLLQSQIKESDALAFAGIPDSLLQREYDLRIDITYYDKKRQEKISEGLSETDTTVLAISSKLFDLNQEYEALKTRFEKDYPDYYRLKYDRSTVSLAYVQDTLLQSGQTLLEYFVGDSSIFVFVVKPNDYRVVEVKKDFPLEEWVKQLQRRLYGYHSLDAAERTDERYKQTVLEYAEVAPKLYDKLIAPVKEWLTEEIIVVPDGVLGYVPFEALLSASPTQANNFGTYPFLLKDHQISYCYSATLLREMKEKQHKRQPSKSLVAFAPFYEGSYVKLDEEFGGGLDTLAAALDLPGFDDLVTRKEFNSLPNSGEEVFAAGKLWKGDYFINSDATEQRFNEAAGDYRIVHLSTHGIADSRVGDYSYLAFAELKDSIENEYLYVRDLYNLQLNADLVVLSACETATGELQRGEGIISLARAFAYAGAKSILTTLWVVDDAATKDVMKEFYLQLKKGKSKDEALRNARLKYLQQAAKKDPKKAHPFFWAGIIPVGDMEALK